VVVGCRRRGEQLALQVHDTGSGIGPGQLDQIFEEFVRLPGADAAQSGGLGLGLAIVKRTAALLGHPLRVHSIPGRGSLFEIEVERFRAAMALASASSGTATARETLQGSFALIVDDDEGNRQALQALCARWGCHVAVAATGEAAMAELSHHLRAPDIVLTDLRLGDAMDGLELIIKVREAAGEIIPGLLVTADTRSEVMERARSIGTEVLHKPASADRVFAAACLAIARQRKAVDEAPLSA
jgi:CheY-like chemotaxis protein